MRPSEDFAAGSSVVTVKAGATNEPFAESSSGSASPTPAPSVPEGQIEFLDREIDPSVFSVTNRAAALQPAKFEWWAGKRLQGANPWELATNPFVRRVLASEIPAGRKVLVATTPDQRCLESNEKD